jgi:DNA-binding response OmpR family regulator
MPFNPKRGIQIMDRPRILLAESDAVVALDLAGELVDSGFQIVGMAHSMERLVRKVERSVFDIALIAVRLDGEFTFPVARMLRARNRPFAFITAFEANYLPADLSDVPMVEKPFLSADIAALAHRLMTSRSPGHSHAA